jgi:hypothetical protein
VAESVGKIASRFPIDNRESVAKEKPKLNQSIIDRETFLLREKLNDPTLDPRFVARCIQNLSEKDINDFLDYVDRKAVTHKGRAFVKLCANVMRYRAL